MAAQPLFPFRYPGATGGPGITIPETKGPLTMNEHHDATVRRVRMEGGTTGPWFRYYVDCACAGERGYLTFFDDYRAAADARRFAATHNAIGTGPVH